MKVIIGKRRSGKTTRLIELSAETGAYIVCTNPDDVASKAREMKLSIPFPLTYDEFLKRQYDPKGVNGVLIDEVGMLVDHLSLVKVKAITVSEEEDGQPLTSL